MEFQLRARVVVSSPFKGLSAYATGRKLKGLRAAEWLMATKTREQTRSRGVDRTCVCARTYIYTYYYLV